MNKIYQETTAVSTKNKAIDETSQPMANKTVIKNPTHMEGTLEQKRFDRVPTQSAVQNAYSAYVPPQKSAPFLETAPTEQMIVRPLPPQQNNVVLNPVPPTQETLPKARRRCCNWFTQIILLLIRPLWNGLGIANHIPWVVYHVSLTLSRHPLLHSAAGSASMVSFSNLLRFAACISICPLSFC